MGLNLDAVGSSSEPVERSWEQQGRPALRARRGCRRAGPDRLRARVHDGELRRRDPARPARPSPPSSGRAGGAAVPRRLRPGDARPRRAVHPPPRRAARRRERCRPPRRWPACTTRARPAWSCSRASRATPGAASRPSPRRTSAVHPRRGRLRRPAQPRGRRRRARWPAEPLPTREPDEVVSYATRSRPGAALPAQRRPQPVALRPRGSPPAPASPGRSCTACAPTASPAGRCSTRCAARTRRASAPCGPASPSRPCPATRCTVSLWDVGDDVPRAPTGSAPGRSAARPSWMPGCSAWPAEAARHGSAAAVGADPEDLDGVRHVAVAEVRGGGLGPPLQVAGARTSVPRPHRRHTTWWWWLSLWQRR